MADEVDEPPADIERSFVPGKMFSYLDVDQDVGTKSTGQTV